MSLKGSDVELNQQRFKINCQKCVPRTKGDNGVGGGGSGEKKYMKKISHEIKKITKKDRNYFTSRNSRNVEHNK